MATYIDHSVVPAFSLEGRYVMILYPQERKWHERLVVLRSVPSSDQRTLGWCVTATPDGDVYAEPLAPPNVVAVALLAEDRALPPGLLRRNAYRFEDGAIGHAPSAAEAAHLRGVAQTELEALQREIDQTDAGGHCWTPSRDQRYGTDGKRRRELRDGVELASESTWSDWPIKGPRTAKWVGQYVVTNGGSPISMHNAWKVNSKLQPSDNGVLEHESICKALELAIEYDQLNIGELATMELLCRRLQMIQYRWKDRVLGSYSSGTVDDESHFFLGVDPTRGNLCICPALNTWLGEELHKEAQANKEQRKAREERALLRANKPKQRDLLPLRLPTVENGIQGVQTLNHLYGQDEVRSFAPVGPQASSLDGMAHKYRRVGPPPQSRPEEALQALLGSMSVYSLDNIECNVASFDEALVSWPEPGSRPVRIADHLASDSGNLLSLAGASELLAEADALSGCDPVKPYIDPVLLHSPVHMGRFCGRLFKSRMLQFVPGKFDHTVGVFFVRKKSGKLRLILDTRKVAEGDVLYTAAGDVADAFHRMELPSCGPEDFVTPAGLLETDRIEDRTWTGQVRAGRTIHAQYVDNFFVSGIDSGVVQQSFDRMKCILEDWGFSIHEVTEAQPVVHGLGLVIDGESRSVSLTPARIWKLRLAALALSRRRVPPPAKVIEKVVGHFTFAMMVRRECLSVFSAVYKYIRFKGQSDPSCRPQQAHGLLWRAAQQELVQASSILPLMCTSLDLPWSPVVTATDASEIGYGVCQRHLGCDQVAQVGRSCERWRYAVEGAIKARSNALGAGGDHADDQAQYECARIRDSEFKEVGASVLDPSAWHVVFSGRWQFHENILRTEGRAMLSGARHLLRSQRHAGRHHLLLVDNLALALSFLY
ncbi:unnamed protein product [Symbiodinium sp. CCMP2456]|nr:unnamed protein product [Symbiodinium sp. CCMP2456]